VNMSGPPAAKPVNAFLLTLLGPGLGHLYAGNRVRGARIAFTVFALMVVAILATLLPPANRMILALMALPLLAIPLFQIGAAIDAARVARSRSATDGSADLYVVGAVVWVVALATFAGLLYAMSSLRSVEVATDDMAPTLLEGDRVLAWQGYYKSHLPRRGDVCVVLLPGVNGPRIMRIIGLPGDSIVSALGVLTVNGTAVQRTRLDDFSWRDAAGTHRNAMRWRETLPGGPSYEILQSPEGMLRGTLLGASLRIPDGSYFVIGDNRIDTQSSWDFGFLPGEVVSDRPIMIIGSRTEGRVGQGIEP